MILNHSYEELKKLTKDMSVLDKCIFLDELKAKEEDVERMEKTLEAGSNRSLKNKTPKKWCWSHNDVL